jgi:hypothetical protein
LGLKCGIVVVILVGGESRGLREDASRGACV